jgi:hypothetical protein
MVQLWGEVPGPRDGNLAQLWPRPRGVDPARTADQGGQRANGVFKIGDA